MVVVFMHLDELVTLGKSGLLEQALLKGSWDLVARVVNRVTLLIITYNPNKGTYNLTY